MYPKKPQPENFNIDSKGFERKIQEFKRYDKIDTIIALVVPVVVSILSAGVFIYNKYGKVFPAFDGENSTGNIILSIVLYPTIGYSSYFIQAFTGLFYPFYIVIMWIVFSRKHCISMRAFGPKYYAYKNAISEYKDNLHLFYISNPEARRFGENFEEYEKYRLARIERLEKERAIQLKKESFWFSLSGFAFEHEVAKIYQKHGFDARPTCKTGDGGVDIILKDQFGKKIYVQCKNHKNPIGPATVRELYGVMTADNVKEGILICSGGFTSGVYQFVKNVRIKLLDVKDLVKLAGSNAPTEGQLNIFLS